MKIKIREIEVKIDKSLEKKLKKYSYTPEKAVKKILSDKIERWLWEAINNREREEREKRELKKIACKRCGGIPVTSYVTHLAAMDWGKICKCKKPLE